jgi:hypothetical protein
MAAITFLRPIAMAARTSGRFGKKAESFARVARIRCPFTTGPLSYQSPTAALSGNRLFVIGEQQRAELQRLDFKFRQFVPFLNGISAGEIDFSRDGQWVTYTSCPNNVLWRSRSDGSENLQLTALAQRFFDIDLWLVGAAHFVILIASFQVPYRRGWKQDLRQLMPFNRKLLWVQSGFTVLTIIAFGTLTLVLHAELLRGDHAALGLACFIGIYWTTRILVDALNFSHADWPKGTEFVIGHALLTLLFSVLAASYLGLFVWHVWLGPNS